MIINTSFSSFSDEFKKNTGTKIIIHGFMSGWESGWMHAMKDELLIEVCDRVVAFLFWKQLD